MSEETIDTGEREKQLVTQYAELKGKKAKIDADLKEINAQLYGLEQEIALYLESQDKKSTARYEGIGHLTLAEPVARVRVDKEQEGVLFDWLRKNELGDIIRTNVNSNTLGAVVRNRLKDGFSEPPGCIVFYQRNIVYTPHVRA